MSVVFGVFSVL